MRAHPPLHSWAPLAALRAMFLASLLCPVHGQDVVAGSKTSSYPNIVFILADDLPWNAGGFGEYGSSSDLHFATPNLNAYADAGIKLTNYYTQEVCTPTRASLMTGRYPLTLGMQYGSISHTSPWGLPFDEITIANVLKDSGRYTNYMLGKWNLGHFSPKLLPTARGFDYYLAYQAGATLYWSKFHSDSTTGETTATQYSHFTDLTYGTNTCFSEYDGDDLHDYSTFLYRDKAINIIKKHDYDAASLFLFLGFQAVHDPYEDVDFESGVPRTYLSGKMYRHILSEVSGRKRRQLGMALNLLDSAVNSVIEAVDEVGQSSNTFIIFASDNGGCAYSGGRNGPLRGSKASLFEGGTKVNAFVYSSTFADSGISGTTYKGLLHVSDWFPTILGMTGISYSPASGHTLDGYDQWTYIQNASSASDSPRTHMLYNYYMDVDHKSWNESVRAVRNGQYKLIETYTGSGLDDTVDADYIEDDDADLSGTTECSQGNLGTVYSSMLFDLDADPYESNNLYYDDDYADVVAELSLKLAEYAENAQTDLNPTPSNKECYNTWRDAGNVIIPWVKEQEKGEGYPTFKKKGCDYTLVSPVYRDNDDDDDFRYVDDDDFEDTEPTMQPTRKPTSPTPTKKPSFRPTAKPSKHGKSTSR